MCGQITNILRYWIEFGINKIRKSLGIKKQFLSFINCMNLLTIIVIIKSSDEYHDFETIKFGEKNPTKMFMPKMKVFVACVS